MWVNSANVLQQGVSIADPTSGYQAGVDSAGAFFGMSSLSAQGASLQAMTNSMYGSGVNEAAVVSSLYALTNSLYASVSSIYPRLASVESWSFISGAGLVTDADYKYGPIYVDATYEYYGKTHDIDAALGDSVWQVRRLRLSDSYVQYADGDVEFNNVFTSLSIVAALTFV
jgi:hypothetical protein